MNKIEIIAKGTIPLGKIDFSGSGRKINRALFTWRLQRNEYGPEFSACGEVWNSTNTDILMSGQCLEDLAPYAKSKRAKRCLEMWRKRHLNGMCSGTIEQEEYLSERTRANPKEWHGYQSHYDWACAILKEANLYEVPLPQGVTCTGGFPPDVVSGERGYRYGERWIYHPLPQEIIDEVMSWQDTLDS